MKPEKLKLAVCGSFGYGNAGDEAVPLALGDMLNELNIDGHVSVLSRYEEPPMDDVIGLGQRDAFRRENLAIQPVVYCGGGIIEQTSNGTSARCAKVVRKIADGRERFLAVSVEPSVRYPLVIRARLTMQLARTGKVFVRDVLSERTVKQTFPMVKASTVGDIVLWMRPGFLPSWLSHMPKRYVAVILAPRWQGDPDWEHWIANELVCVAEMLSATLVFVPMSCDYDDDRQEHHRIANYIREVTESVELLEIDRALAPRELAAVLSGAISTISMRLHGCVMAYAQRRPFVAVAYHPKLYGFADTVGMLAAVVPQSSPAMQHPNAYGFRFSDLGIRRGELVNTVVKTMADINFQALDELRSRSLGALNEIVEEWR